MKTNEDRMIDFVAKSYEENRFDPKKALARSQNGSLRRSLSLSKRTVMLKRIAGVAAAAAVGIFLYLSWLTSWTGYAAYDIAQTFTSSPEAQGQASGPDDRQGLFPRPSR